MTPAKTVKVSGKAYLMIKEISEKRKKEGSFIRSNQDVLTEAVQALHKKEFK